MIGGRVGTRWTRRWRARLDSQEAIADRDPPGPAALFQDPSAPDDARKLLDDRLERLVADRSAPPASDGVALRVLPSAAQDELNQEELNSLIDREARAAVDRLER